MPKTKYFKFRVNEKERSLLKENAKRNHVSASEWIRLRCVYAKDESLPVIDTSPLKDLVFELNKAGVNLNQYMKFVNTYKAVGYQMQDGQKVLEENQKAFRRVLEALEILNHRALQHKVSLWEFQKESEEDTGEA